MWHLHRQKHKSSSVASKKPAFFKMVQSHYLRLPHDRLRLLADLAAHFVRIALLEFRQEELDRQRSRVASFGEFTQDLCKRAHSIARDEAGGLVEQFTRDIRHVLKVDVCDLAWVNA